MCSRAQLAFRNVARTDSSKRDHNRGKRLDKRPKWIKEKNPNDDTITHLRAKNATYSIHHVGVATRGAGRGKEARPGRRAQEERFEE